MGTKYPGNADTGYNASPPPDDGSTGSDNLVTWAKHKTKLTDPLLAYIDAINDDLNTWADVTPTAKSTAYTTVVSDHLKVIETTSSPTISLGAAATMGAGYEVTVKAVSGTTTVSTSDTIDGSASNRTLNAGESETYVVNNGGGAYMIKQNKAITQTETATMSNKTLTSPVLNTGLSGTAIIDDDTMATVSDTTVCTGESIKAYIDDLMKIAVINYEEAANTTGDIYTAGGWRTVDLNTEAYNSDSLVALATSQITPVAGEYQLHAELAIYTATGAVDAKLRLYNATQTTAVKSGVQSHSGGGNQQTSNATLDCVFTADGLDAYELQVYPLGNDTDATPAMNIGETEVYAQVTIRKIG